MIGWIAIFTFFGLFVYYGYHLLVKRGSGAAEADSLTAQCHLCRERFPVKSMIAREKAAGFVNYFCGECIEKLYSDYVAANRG